MLISLAHSLECTKQTLTNNSLYTKCVDLPSLNAYLHWTYDVGKSSLSIAFVAPPAKSDGWIAWAINPTATGMIGSQSLIAFKAPDSKMTMKTYNITSYGPVTESKIDYAVSGMKAEYDGKVMTMYATLVLPEKMTVVNQVWQVGGAVSGGVPQKHEFGPANLKAMGMLDLSKGWTRAGVSVAPASSPVVSPVMAPSTETTKAPVPSADAGLRIMSIGFIWMMISIAILL